MSVRIYPYEVLTRPGVLTVPRVTVDGHRPERDVQAQTNSLDLSVLPPWRRASIRLEAAFPADDLARLATDVHVVATLHCGPTNLRTSAELTSVGPGRWQGELAVDRGLVAGRAELSVVAAGRSHGVPERYIGRTNSFPVHLDVTRRPLPNHVLPVLWSDFSQQDAPVPSEFRNQPHYIDVSHEPPTIWLNSSIPGLRNLLADTRGLPPEAQAMRSMYLNAIATSGWLALFNAATANITGTDGEERGMPSVPWQEQVLETLLPLIYPDLTLSVAVGKAAEDIQDSTMNRVLQARAQGAIGELQRTTTKLRRAVDQLQMNLKNNPEEELA